MEVHFSGRSAEAVYERVFKDFRAIVAADERVGSVRVCAVVTESGQWLKLYGFRIAAGEGFTSR
jgi:hypothetical protein